MEETVDYSDPSTETTSEVKLCVFIHQALIRTRAVVCAKLAKQCANFYEIASYRHLFSL